MIKHKTILVIGGTGSLGYKLTERYLEHNIIYCMSRDESKHWKMALDFEYNNNLKFIIGDIRNNKKIRQTLLRVRPNVVILAAAMKHIDKCEFESDECISTNLIGTQNVLNEIEYNINQLDNLESVCFVSTDKACSPVNIYGMTKAISESLVVEKSKFIKKIKFVVVRYGNILNSNGSIIPMLHDLGKNPNVKEFKLTNQDMTRFIMTLDQSVDLIDHSIVHAVSGDIVVSELQSCKIKDLFDIFSEIYKKPVVLGSLRPGEKIIESLINETQSIRTVFGARYYYIKPQYSGYADLNNIRNYDSTTNCLSKNELHAMLTKLNLI